MSERVDDVSVKSLLVEVFNALVDLRAQVIDLDNKDFDSSGHWEYIDPIDKLLNRIGEFI